MTTQSAHRSKYLHHQTNGWINSFREIIFGLEDGLVSTLGVVVGIAAASSDARIVIISGLVVIFVEALSMSAGTYLSNKSQQELHRHFLSEQAHEIKDDFNFERAETVKYLKKMGYQDKEIPALVERIINDTVMWKRFLAINELGFDPNRKNHSVIMNTLSMWLAYFVGGSIALLAFLFVPLAQASIVAVILVVLGLFALGAIKGLLLKMRWLLSGLEMMIIGLLAAGMGQLIGYLAHKLII